MKLPTHVQTATIIAVLLTLSPGGPIALAQDGTMAERQRETRTRELERSVQVGGRSVTIGGTGMRLEVEPGAGDQATVEALLEYWSDDGEWMENVERNYEIGVREVGGRIEFDLGGMPERRSGGVLRRLFGSEETHWSLTVTLTVPRGTEVEVANSYGPVEVHGIEGALRVSNSSGAVRISEALRVSVDNAYAEVNIVGARGRVEVNASSGRVDVRDVTGSVEVTTSYASLEIENVEGDVEASVGSGELAIRDVRGSVRSRNSYAQAAIEDVTGGLDHETSSGSVRILRIGGAVRAVGSYGEMEISQVPSAEIRNGSGAVTVDSVPGDVRISNSYAPVVARSVGGELVVDSSSAGVTVREVDGPVTVTTSYDGVSIQGVGGAVTVRNSSGRVNVSGFRGGALSARHTIETSYAGIEIGWPSGAELGIEAECTYGSISSDLGGRVEGGGSGSRQRLVREAAGGAQMKLVATSGGISIRSR